MFFPITCSAVKKSTRHTYIQNAWYLKYSKVASHFIFREPCITSAEFILLACVIVQKCFAIPWRFWILEKGRAVTPVLKGCYLLGKALRQCFALGPAPHEGEARHYPTWSSTAGVVEERVCWFSWVISWGILFLLLFFSDLICTFYFYRGENKLLKF